MTTAEYLARIAQRAEQPDRECECPAYVLACVHVEGGGLAWLADSHLYLSCSGHYDEYRYTVVVGAAVEPCLVGGEPVIGRPYQCVVSTDSLPEARAEFFRRAQELSHD